MTECASQVFRRFVTDAVVDYGGGASGYIEQWIDKVTGSPWDMMAAVEEFFVGLTQEGGSREQEG